MAYAWSTLPNMSAAGSGGVAAGTSQVCASWGSGATSYAYSPTYSLAAYASKYDGNTWSAANTPSGYKYDAWANNIGANAIYGLGRGDHDPVGNNFLYTHHLAPQTYEYDHLTDTHSTLVTGTESAGTDYCRPLMAGNKDNAVLLGGTYYAGSTSFRSTVLKFVSSTWSTLLGSGLPVNAPSSRACFGNKDAWIYLPGNSQNDYTSTSNLIIAYTGSTWQYYGVAAPNTRTVVPIATKMPSGVGAYSGFMFWGGLDVNNLNQNLCFFYDTASDVVTTGPAFPSSDSGATATCGAMSDFIASGGSQLVYQSTTYYCQPSGAQAQAFRFVIDNNYTLSISMPITFAMNMYWGWHLSASMPIEFSGFMQYGWRMACEPLPFEIALDLSWTTPLIINIIPAPFEFSGRTGWNMPIRRLQPFNLEVDLNLPIIMTMYVTMGKFAFTMTRGMEFNMQPDSFTFAGSLSKDTLMQFDIQMRGMRVDIELLNNQLARLSVIPRGFGFRGQI